MCVCVFCCWGGLWVYIWWYKFGCCGYGVRGWSEFILWWRVWLFVCLWFVSIIVVGFLWGVYCFKYILDLLWDFFFLVEDYLLLCVFFICGFCFELFFGSWLIVLIRVCCLWWCFFCRWLFLREEFWG